MNEQQRRELVKNHSYTWDGIPCSVGGWKASSYASIAPATGGFYRIRWKALELVAAGAGNISRSSCWLVSKAWTGYMTEAEAEACREHWAKGDR